MKPLSNLVLGLFGLLVCLSGQAAEHHDHDRHDAGRPAEAHGHEPHEHGDDDDGEETGEAHDHHDHEALASHIDDGIAEQVGIRVTPATARTLRQTIIAYGSLTTAPEQLSHVRARYSGLIASVKATVGDVVAAGDLLALVESNESLRTYGIRAPIAGTVVQRHANAGEVSGDQVLFSIANFDMLWAELRIYPTQQVRVRPGQSVILEIGGREVRSQLRNIIPALDKPYRLARTRIDNTGLGLSPGLLVEGHIETGEIPVPLAVEKTAVQTLGGRPGVFVRDADEYTFTPLVLGRSDGHYVEVLEGLEAGQSYVHRNSYLLKADIEKSEAGHEH